MKTISSDCNSPIFQGDLMIIRCNEVPENAKEVADGILSHSETGHAHIAERARVFQTDPMTLFVHALAGDGIDIVHKRPSDQHETIRLLGDEKVVWKIRRQREWIPESWRAVQD